MYTKSKIQLVRESLQKNDQNFEAINSLIDKYLVEDNIFTFHNNTLCEVTKGYFVTGEEYNDLREAVSNMSHGMAMRIINNERFITGRLYNTLHECGTDSVVFDINSKSMTF